MLVVIISVAVAIGAQIAKGIITSPAARRTLTMTVMSAASVGLGAAVVLATQATQTAPAPSYSVSIADTVVVRYADEPATEHIINEEDAL